MAEKKEKDELTFDFSKIKKFFKKSEPKKETEKEEKEFTFDVVAIKNFFARYNKILISVVLIFICMFFSIYLRLYVNYLPITDEWAESTVYNYYRNSIMEQINQQYPNLPDANKNALAEKQFQEFLSQNKGMVDGQIKEVSNSFKNKFKDENGYTYLGDIDSYFWMRYAKNIIEKGQYGDEINDGEQWDSHMLAPVGSTATVNLYPYIEAINYKIMHFFNPKITLMQSIFYVPMILSLFAVVAAFFIAKKFAGYFGGFFAAFLIAIHPLILSRTFGSDNDIINIFFPLIILWLFIEAFEAKEKLKGIIISALTGFVIGLFSFAWSGWWFILYFIVASCGIYIIYYVIKDFKYIKKNFMKYIKKSEILNVLLVLGVIFVFSVIFVSIFSGFGSIARVTYGPIKFLKIKAATQASEELWPNVYTTVAELNESSLSEIVTSVGGKMLFFLSIIGIILTVVKKDEKGKRDVKFAVFLIIWYLATIFASLKGVRFILLLIPAVCIAVGIAVGIIYQYLNKWLSSALDINKNITRVILVILFLLLFIQPLRAADNSSRKEVPIMNDEWYSTLTLIKQNSTSDAIINSWWDFGHHFKFVADRRVTADGASQNRPQAHWVGKVLLTSDEKEAVGILRMLDCSGDIRAFSSINRYINDTSKTIEVIHSIIVVDKDKATNILEYYMPKIEAKNIVNNYTHCQPPEDYFITSQDMVSKAGVWGHFGSWDFRKAEMWNNVKRMKQDMFIEFMEKEFNYSERDATSIYYELKALPSERDANNWIAPWPGYAGYYDCDKEYDKVNNKIRLKCQNGITIMLNEKEVSIPTTAGIMNPYSLGYIKNNEFVIKKFENNTLEGLSIDLYEDPNLNYHIIMMSPELAGSIFTRLFFYDGFGLKHFEKFNDVKDVTGSRIITWKINWEGK